MRCIVDPIPSSRAKRLVDKYGDKVVVYCQVIGSARCAKFILLREQIADLESPFLDNVASFWDLNAADLRCQVLAYLEPDFMFEDPVSTLSFHRFIEKSVYEGGAFC